MLQVNIHTTQACFSSFYTVTTNEEIFPRMQDLLRYLPSQSREPTAEIIEQPVASTRGQNLQT
jgi:hypothetical protein